MTSKNTAKLKKNPYLKELLHHNYTGNTVKSINKKGNQKKFLEPLLTTAERGKKIFFYGAPFHSQ